MLSSLLNSSLSGDSTSYEELLLNVIAACTNITYYSSQVTRTSRMLHVSLGHETDAHSIHCVVSATMCRILTCLCVSLMLLAHSS